MTLFSRLVVVAAFLAAALTIPRWVTTHPAGAELERLQADYEHTREQNHRLAQENELLYHRAAATWTNETYRRELARERERLFAPNEVLVRFSGDD